ncbi:UDP-glucuronosyltransferase 2A2 [Collichthys lucidus]|uniref:UDP-glucuronosyltransferase n=1 Tax=Collichthys lucidus TaxID=240159 RepID=A0A4U5U6B8_COLLU|nr:UDP-glucuronosyltransferase 2A2 [Collichthys lucidus]
MRLLCFYIALLLLIFTPKTCQGGNILVFPTEGSHWINMDILLQALHSKGHNITILRSSKSWYINEKSSYYNTFTVQVERSLDEKAITEIISDLIEFEKGAVPLTSFLHVTVGFFSKLVDVHTLMGEFVSTVLGDQELMRTMKDSKFDLMLTDPCSGGGIILAKYLNLPLVYNVRWILAGEGHLAIAPSPSPLSYVPLPPSELSDEMTFFDRVKNMLFYTMRMHLYKQVVGPHYSALSSRYFGPDVDYFTLFQAADLWLMRVDFVFEFPRPTMPNVIYMGGFQCKPAKPLPEHLEEFVQSSGEHGVIIMSLGTLIAKLPHDLAEEIAAAFAKLPQKVIWRYKGDRPATLGNNTLLVDWMPQNDLLGHPKIKLFVSHGGTNGIYEAIYHGVPIVGIPIVFDQADNLSRLRAKGVAKVMDISELDGKIFHEAIQEVVNQPSYRMNMQRLSRLHRDQPMKPLDTALFWIEFVMRHKGAAHLRTESYRLPWYSYHSLDVILFLLTITLLIVLLFAGLVRSCFGLCLKRKVKSD